MRHLGLLERDGDNLKLTAEGREYAAGDVPKRGEVIRGRLRADPLYNATLDWMHYQKKFVPSKTDVANYWHDHHGDAIGGAEGDALTHAAVFFMRMVGLAELGKFTPAGRGRDTHLKMDEARLDEFATGAPPPDPVPERDAPPVPPTPAPPVAPAPAGAVTIGAGLNVNLEIHIAADAKPATVEEIFKNMRKYLIDRPDSSADGG